MVMCIYGCSMTEKHAAKGRWIKVLWYASDLHTSYPSLHWVRDKACECASCSAASTPIVKIPGMQLRDVLHATDTVASGTALHLAANR